MLAVSRRWSEPEAAYRRWHRERAGNDFGLGAVQVVQVERMVWVANMVGQHGIRTGSKGVPVRYEAIDTALGALAGRAAELGGRPCTCRVSAAGWPGDGGSGSSRWWRSG